MFDISDFLNSKSFCYANSTVFSMEKRQNGFRSSLLNFSSVESITIVIDCKLYWQSKLEPHLHSATGPGSSKFPCKAVVLEDGTTQAIEMEMSPMHENDEMIAM